MGQYSKDALGAGQQLGLASYYISIRNSGAANAALVEASDMLNHLSPIVVVQINPGSILTEQDVINVRQQVGGKLDGSNKVLHASYQLGLHLGLALGQSGAPAAAWSAAVPLCKLGIKQAQDDLHDPALYFLAGTPFDQNLAKISAAINPQHHSTEPWEDLTAELNQLAATLGNAPPPVP
jgi:hypothetical protein